MVTKYDTIANRYKKCVGTALREFVHDYTFNAIVDEITRTSKIDPKVSKALDLACGEGRYTRNLRERGFQKVLGIDISQKMIDLATEHNNDKNIEYLARDVANMETRGEFDLVTAWFLLHYATSKEHLEHMCEGISRNMKEDSYFVGYQSNPFGSQTRDSPEYGETKRVLGEEKEGADVEVILRQGGKEVKFIRKYWKPETYENAFLKAGLKVEGWKSAIVSPRGIEAQGEDFWKEYQLNPSHAAIICRK